MWRTLCCLWVMTLSLLHWTDADSDFCARPANMDLCWWRNNIYKRYLRFGRSDSPTQVKRGDPYLRFGRGDPYLRFGRGDPYLRFGRGDPYLRFGRGDPYLRFGRGGEPYLRFGRAEPYLRFGRADPYLRFGRAEPYLRFGRADPYLRFGRGDPYLRFGRGDPYLRFGRGDPFLRFGRSQAETMRYNPFNLFGKRDGDSESLENGGYLRFGRSESSQPSPVPLQEQPSEGDSVVRKRRDVSGVSSSMSPEVHRTIRDVKDGGFLRFGRTKALAGNLSSPQPEEAPAKRADPEHSDLHSPGRDYPQFGHAYYYPERFAKRTGTYLRFGRGGYLRFGKRSDEKA